MLHQFAATPRYAFSDFNDDFIIYTYFGCVCLLKAR